MLTQPSYEKFVNTSESRRFAVRGDKEDMIVTEYRYLENGQLIKKQAAITVEQLIQKIKEGYHISNLSILKDVITDAWGQQSYDILYKTNQARKLTIEQKKKVNGKTMLVVNGKMIELDNFLKWFYKNPWYVSNPSEIKEEVSKINM